MNLQKEELSQTQRKKKITQQIRIKEENYKKMLRHQINQLVKSKINENQRLKKLILSLKDRQKQNHKFETSLFVDQKQNQLKNSTIYIPHLAQITFKDELENEELQTEQKQSLQNETMKTLISFAKNKQQYLLKISKIKEEGNLFTAHMRVIAKQYLDELRERNLKIKQKVKSILSQSIQKQKLQSKLNLFLAQIEQKRTEQQ